MTIDSLRLFRNILLRSVVIGIAITFLLAAVTFGAWDTWTGAATKWFHTDEATIVPLVMNFFVDIRFFLLFVLLTPGLAIHWTIKRELSRKT